MDYVEHGMIGNVEYGIRGCVEFGIIEYVERGLSYACVYYVEQGICRTYVRLTWIMLNKCYVMHALC